MPAISADALSKTYTDFVNKNLSVTALSDFTINVEQGQIFGLLGPNGAGKTTFIKILLGLVNATSGRASILGKQLPDVKVRERIGYLPESHRYPGYLTASQVMNLFGGLSGIPPAQCKPKAKELLRLVGIEQWSGMKVKKFSKGMMQRLGLAQALINDPDVIFLDEPTDGVDPVGRKEIRDILRKLKSEGKTIFLNSHLLSEVELVSDQVAILNKGRLLKVGTVDELTSTGSVYEVGFEAVLPETFTTEASAHVVKLNVSGSSMTAELNTTAELNRLIDMLRRHGVEITYITKKRSSLEDSFINLIKREVA